MSPSLSSPDRAASHWGKQRALNVFAIACVFGVLVGCATAPLTPVPLSDFQTVVGQWDGMETSPPGAVILQLSENRTYLFASQRSDSVMVGEGTFVLRDGKLYDETGKRDVVMTFARREERSVLVVDGTSKTGRRYHVEFTRRDESQ